MALTAARIKALEPAARDYEEPDGHGLVLRVWPSGTKSWCVWHRDQGRSRRTTIGRWPDMSINEARAQRRSHTNSAAEAKALTAGDFAPRYIEGHAKPTKSSWADDERFLERHILPARVTPPGRRRPVAFRTRPLAQLTRDECAQVTDPILERGCRDMASRVHACLRRFLQYAVELGLLTANPAARMGRRQSDARSRVMGSEEIVDWWPEVQGLPSPAARIALALVLVTCQRPGEVLELERADIDRIDRLWLVPAAKAKNGIDHVVPLTDTALGLIDEARTRWPSSRCVIPICDSTLRKWMARAVRNAGVKRVTPHDLRRTGTTWLGYLKYSRTIQDRILNHKDRSTGGIYDRYDYLAEKREALETWEARLTDTLGVHLHATCDPTRGAP